MDWGVVISFNSVAIISTMRPDTNASMYFHRCVIPNVLRIYPEIPTDVQRQLIEIQCSRYLAPKAADTTPLPVNAKRVLGVRVAHRRARDTVPTNIFVICLADKSK